METAWRSPLRYIQGPGVITSLADHMSSSMRSPAVLATRSRLNHLRKPLTDSLPLRTLFAEFRGECSDAEIDRHVSALQKADCDVIVAVGGGKTLDTGKAVAHRLNLETIAVPTIAATDAPTAAAAIVYSEDGVFERAEIYPRSPYLVLVDTDVVRKAPVRFLVSGMGDALATWFEADACRRSGARTVAGGLSTQAAQAIAQRCYQVLRQHGRQAVTDFGGASTTDSIERIVEANTLLSGVGFESGGLAAAHSIHNGFTTLAPTHRFYHGEKVAFSTVCQLLLEDKEEEAREVASFNQSVGLPVRLADLGLGDVSHGDLELVAETACTDAESIHNMPFKVSPGDVVSSIKRADALGKAITG